MIMNSGFPGVLRAALGEDLAQLMRTQRAQHYASESKKTCGKSRKTVRHLKKIENGLRFAEPIEVSSVIQTGEVGVGKASLCQSRFHRVHRTVS